jgi:hypothetical protein
MKIAIDDKCNTEFRRLKFDKAYRYLIFTIEKEHIVHLLTFRSSNMWGKGKKLGITSFISCLLMKADIAYSTLNIKQATASIPVKYSSASGYLK